MSGDARGRVTELRASPPTLESLLVEVETRLRAAGRGETVGVAIDGMLDVPDLARLVRRCELSPFEAQVVLLGAAMQLQAEVPSLCAAVAGDEAARHPSFAVALQTFADGHWDALLPGSPLRRLELLELGEGAVLTARPLHLAERVLHALLGQQELDPRVARRVHRLERPTECPPRHRALLAELEDSRLVHLQVARAGEAMAWGAELAALRGRAAFVLSPQDVPVDAGERNLLLRLWNREARLAEVTLVVDLDDRTEAAQLRATMDLLDRCEGPAIAASIDPLPGARGGWRRAMLPDLAFEERRALWEGGLGPDDAALLDDLAARFELDATQIASVARSHPPERAWEASRALARPRLDDLAQRIDPPDDVRSRLVLPPAQTRMLGALLAQVRHKATVQHRWGLARRGRRGLGTSAVFSGPSGTGKTLAAEVIAAELGLDLYRIDLSNVVSKYIGETEKNLRQVFDAAEAGGAVLLFDEADALFGKRTDVKDAKDRHANIEVAYLLQRMETYGGLAILTTNFRKALDDAFLRRLQFIVEFPFPDADQRSQIWARAFPNGVPTRGLDLNRLGQLSVPGGNIASIARNAAYLAADHGTPVTMSVVLEAARLEAEKLGRGLTPAELRGWPR